MLLSPALQAMKDELDKTNVISEDFKRTLLWYAMEARREGFNDPKGER